MKKGGLQPDGSWIHFNMVRFYEKTIYSRPLDDIHPAFLCPICRKRVYRNKSQWLFEEGKRSPWDFFFHAHEEDQDACIALRNIMDGPVP